MKNLQLVYGAVPKTFPLSIQSEAIAVDKWLLQIAAFRKQLPVEERLNALLWSWPIRRALTPKRRTSLWNCDHDDEDTLERKRKVLAGLEWLASYWYPFGPQKTLSDPSFRKRCATIYDDLLALENAPDDLEGPEVEAFLADFVEKHWGDGEYDYRRDEQDRLILRFDEKIQQRICAIAEHARDQAYLFVRTTRLLDAMRTTKQDLKGFANWLREASNHVHLIEDAFRPIAHSPEPLEFNDSLDIVYHEDISALHDAVQVIIAHKHRVLQYLDEKAVGEPTDSLRRPNRGTPPHPSADDADLALKQFKQFKLSRIDRRELLQVWGLKPLDI